MFGPFPIARPRFADAINQPGQHTKRFRRVLSIPCETRTCAVVFPPDVEVYSLQDRLIFNDEPLTFIVNCPTGKVCPPGTWPKVVTYPRGTFFLPDPNTNPGFPILIQMQGCQSVVTRELPATATTAQIQAASQEVILEIAQQQAECDSVDDPPPLNPEPFFSNAEVYANFPCEECAVVDYNGVLPWYITLDRENNRLVLATGIITADTQASANAQAQEFINNFKAQAVAANKLSCVTCTITTSSPLPDGTEGDVYSQALAATGTIGTTVWLVTAGALPDGLSLNSSSGVISGTPIEDGTFTFTVTASAGAQCCSKEFELEIAAIADCLITTSSPLPDATVGTPYSEFLSVSGLVGTPTFSITFGALPGGLSLNSSTGEISGTPTTEETANFTVKVETDMGQECSKPFVLDVLAASVCPDWTQLLWGSPNLVQNGSGTATFTPDSTTGDSWAASAFVLAIGSDIGAATNTALISYNGSGCNCNLHVFMSAASNMGGLSPVSCNVHEHLSVNPPFVEAASFNQGNGTYDIPFSIPAGSYVIAVTVQCVASSSNAGISLISGDISNV